MRNKYTPLKYIDLIFILFQLHIQLWMEKIKLRQLRALPRISPRGDFGITGTLPCVVEGDVM